jgi:hypothetical protein
MNFYAKQFFSLVIIYMFMTFSVYSDARVIDFNSRNRLFSRINQAYIAVVQFYCYSKDRCDREKYRELKNRLQSVSQNGSYLDAEIEFLMMNCSGAPGLARELGFCKYPTLVLFVNGMPLPGAQLTGFPHECDINNLIESHLGNSVDQILRQKRKDQKEREAAQIAGWAAWGPYWANGCGFGYGWCRPCGLYGGWGCGYGRCW